MFLLYIVAGSIALVGGMPFAVAGFRSWSFARSEGERGILLPSRVFDAQVFRKIYSSTNARLRSKGAKFSNLVWYLLAPGSHMHQEVMEDGPQYEAVAAVTKEILAISPKKVNELLTRIGEKWVNALAIPKFKKVFLRDMFMPLWAEFFFELVFEHTPSSEEISIVVENAKDFINTTKFHQLPNMQVRQRMIELIDENLEAGHFKKEFAFPFTREEKCFYLRGLFLTSGVTQLSEAMAHILLCLSEKPELQERLARGNERALLSNVIDETMRLYPLFGVAFRVVSAPIALEDGREVAKDTVVFFNYQDYQQTGFERPKAFDPDRWLTQRKTHCHFIPFGEGKNHACPARGISKLVLGRCIEIVLSRYRVHSSATHTRALPNRGPCLLVARSYNGSLRWPLAFLFIKDRIDIFVLSLKQLVVGFEIKRRAQKMKLASRYFNA